MHLSLRLGGLGRSAFRLRRAKTLHRPLPYRKAGFTLRQVSESDVARRREDLDPELPAGEFRLGSGDFRPSHPLTGQQGRVSRLGYDSRLVRGGPTLQFSLDLLETLPRVGHKTLQFARARLLPREAIFDLLELCSGRRDARLFLSGPLLEFSELQRAGFSLDGWGVRLRRRERLPHRFQPARRGLILGSVLLGTRYRFRRLFQRLHGLLEELDRLRLNLRIDIAGGTDRLEPSLDRREFQVGCGGRIFCRWLWRR